MYHGRSTSPAGPGEIADACITRPTKPAFLRVESGLRILNNPSTVFIIISLSYSLYLTASFSMAAEARSLMDVLLKQPAS